MQLLKIFALSALLSCSTLAHANERMAVFGLEIGKPVTLPACEFNELTRYDSIQKRFCIEPEKEARFDFRTIHFPVNETPSWFSNFAITGKFFDGNLEGVSIFTTGYETKDAVLATLTQKYGQPTSLTERKLQNSFGAQYTSFTAEWLMPGLHVEFTPTYQDNLKEGAIRIETPRARESRLDAIRKSSEKQRAL